jgi:hypothetical protein
MALVGTLLGFSTFFDLFDRLPATAVVGRVLAVVHSALFNLILVIFSTPATACHCLVLGLSALKG